MNGGFIKRLRKEPQKDGFIIGVRILLLNNLEEYMLTVYERGAIREYAKQTRRLANNLLDDDVEVSSTDSDVLNSIENLEKMINEYHVYVKELMFKIVDNPPRLSH
jgi:hypothetical protein